MKQFDVGQDDAKQSIIISLNIARVKCVARISMLEGINRRTDDVWTDQDNWEWARDHITAALSFLDQTRYEKGPIQVELPW